MDGSLRKRAIVVGLVAIAVLLYMNQHRNRRNSLIGGPITVLVANHEIRKGTTGDAIRTGLLYSVANIPKSQIQPGALVDPAALTGKVAVQDINPNVQLTGTEFGPARVIDVGGLAQRAVTVRPRKTGGTIAPGSHVDVLVGVDGHSHELFENMYVLNVSTNEGTVTLRATPQQASTLARLSRTGKHWLVVQR